MCCSGSKIVSGVVGMAKVISQVVGLPVDQAPRRVVHERRDVCRKCPKASLNKTGILTNISSCDACNCIISAKTRIASEACPDGKWGSLPAD